MTKVNIVGLETQTNKKTQEESYIVKALCIVQAYGKPSLELISVRVPSLAPYKKGEATMDIALPHSDYSYALNSYSNS